MKRIVRRFDSALLENNSGDAFQFDVEHPYEPDEEEAANYRARIDENARDAGATIRWACDVYPSCKRPFWYNGRKICDIEWRGWVISVLSYHDGCSIERVDGEEIYSPEDAHAAGLHTDADVNGSPEFDWGLSEPFVYVFRKSDDPDATYCPDEYCWGDPPCDLDEVFDFGRLADLVLTADEEYEYDSHGGDEVESQDDDNDLSEAKSRKRKKRVDVSLIKDAGNVEANVAHFNKVSGASMNCSESGYDGSTNGTHVKFYEAKGESVQNDALPDRDCTEELLDEAPEKHDTLNPALFGDSETLLGDVREALLKIAKDFTDTLDEDEVKYKLSDIKIVGSNCSYNYTDKSDIDLHLVFDLSMYDDAEKEQMAEMLYNYARRLWNNGHDVTIKGIPVEIFVETNNTVDLNSEPKSGLN